MNSKTAITFFIILILLHSINQKSQQLWSQPSSLFFHIALRALWLLILFEWDRELTGLFLDRAGHEVYILKPMGPTLDWAKLPQINSVAIALSKV